MAEQCGYCIRTVEPARTADDAACRLRACSVCAADAPCCADCASVAWVICVDLCRLRCDNCDCLSRTVTRAEACRVCAREAPFCRRCRASAAPGSPLCYRCRYAYCGFCLAVVVWPLPAAGMCNSRVDELSGFDASALCAICAVDYRTCAACRAQAAPDVCVCCSSAARPRKK